MKRIIFLCTDITVKGGIERIVSKVANLLCQSNIEVIIASMCSDADAKLFFPLNSNVKVIHCGYRKPGNKLEVMLLGLKGCLFVKKLMKELHVDYVVGTFWYFSIFLPFLSHIKSIAWEHVVVSAMGRLTRIVKKLFYWRLDAIICLTQADALNHKMKNTCVIPNCNSFEIDKGEYDIESKKIIALGRLTSEKGFDMLLQAALGVKEKHPDWKLEIYGDGEDRSSLLQLVKDLSLDDFVTINPAEKDVRYLLRSSSMYVMSSRYEGFGLVLTEAQCFGLPLVSFDCPSGPGEIIKDGVNGFLVPLGDTELLSEKINELIENPRLRLIFSKNSLKNAEQYREEKIKKKWLDLLEGL